VKLAAGLLVKLIVPNYKHKLQALAYANGFVKKTENTPTFYE